MRRLIATVILSICAGCSAGSKLENDAKDAVKYDLKDPESAQFREVEVYPEKGLVCGEVNAKNSYGAYSGFEPFAYDDGRVSIGEFDQACLDAVVENTIKILRDLRQIKLRQPESPERDQAIADIDAQIAESEAQLAN